MSPLDSEPRAGGPLRAPIYRNLVVLVISLVAVLAALWVVRVNQVTTEIEHPAMTSGTAITIQRGEIVPVGITITPARRAEGASVELNGIAAAHPSGDQPGQLLVDLSKLSPGANELVVRVPRPTWTKAVTTIEIWVDE